MYGSLADYAPPDLKAPSTSSAAPSSSSRLSVPRARFVAVLERRHARARACSALPFAIIAYVFLCALIVLHGHVGTSYDLTSALVDNVVNAYTGFAESVVDSNSWIEYFAGEGASNGALTAADSTGWVNEVLGNRDNGGLLPCNRNVCLRGRVRDTLQIVGGVRFSQVRANESPCVLPRTRSLYGTCHSGGVSTASFGVPGLNTDPEVANAFNSTSLDGVRSFQLWLDTTVTRNVNQRILLKLDQAGWVDNQVSSITVDMAVLDGEVGFVGNVALKSTFTRGGRVTNTYTVAALPLDPYALSPLMETMDVFAVIAFVYIAATSLGGIIKTLRTGGGVKELFSWWSICGYTLSISLFVAILQYNALLRLLADLPIDPQGSIRGDTTDDTDDPHPNYSTGPSDLAVAIGRASKMNAAFKDTLVWVLFAATFLLLRYFAFQPRLAVMTDAFARIAVDLFHFGIVFMLLIVGFWIWGHFQFGSAAPEWQTLSSSFMATMRIYQFDYDLPAMELADRPYADLFFVLILNGITNLALWMLVGIVIEAYMEVRREREADPSLFDEASLWFSQIRVFCAHPRAVARWLMRTGGAGPSGSAAALAVGAIPPYDVILDATLTGPLAHEDTITPEALANALLVNLPAATRLIAGVICASPGDIASGWCAPLPLDVEAALTRVAQEQRDTAFARGKSAIFARVASAAEAAAEAATLAEATAVAAIEGAPLPSPSTTAIMAQLVSLQAAVESLTARLEDGGGARSPSLRV